MIYKDSLCEKYPFLADPSSWYYFMENRGKEIFGSQFFLDPYDFTVIFKMEVFVSNNHERANDFKLNLNKGIILTGPIGCGKTSFILMLRTFLYNKANFKFISAIELSNEYSSTGPKIIDEYVKKHDFLFIDDLGREAIGISYGKKSNVVAEIIRGRYDLKMEGKKIKTYATSNFQIDELLEFYGDDICSRMVSMFNLISFHPNSRDKRK